MKRAYIVFPLICIFFLSACSKNQNIRYIWDSTVSICANSTGPQCNAVGKGFFVSYDGKLLTSAHLVSRGGKTRRIETSSGSYIFQIVSVYEDRDLAILSKPYTTTSPRLFGTGVVLGQSVRIFRDYNMYTGSVVGVGLTKNLGNSFFSRSQNYDDLIEIDISVEAGDSGLPVYDMSGKIVGLVIARSTEGTGSYVVPITKDLLEAK